VDAGATEDHATYTRDRRTFAAVVVVAILVGAVAAGVYYETQGAPLQLSPLIEVSFVGVNVLPSDAMNVVIQLSLGIHNTQDQSVTFYGLLYTLYGNAQTLDAGYIRQDLPIAAGKVFVLNNTYRAELSDTTLQQVNKDTGMTWRISGTAYFGTAGGNQTSPFTVDFETQ